MKQILLILSLVAVLKMNGQIPPSGTYTYKLCYHEWSGCVNTCTVIIQSDTITVYADDDIFVPKGEIIIKGILMQHKSGKWIIGLKPEDKDAPRVGGCGDGPSVIDFKRKRLVAC